MTYWRLWVEPLPLMTMPPGGEVPTTQSAVLNAVMTAPTKRQTTIMDKWNIGWLVSCSLVVTTCMYVLLLHYSTTPLLYSVQLPTLHHTHHHHYHHHHHTAAGMGSTVSVSSGDVHCSAINDAKTFFNNTGKKSRVSEFRSGVRGWGSGW